MSGDFRIWHICDIHRCPLYGRFQGHTGHQPSELSARPSAFAWRTGWVSYGTAVSRIAEPHARSFCQDRYS
jgi:hypothetical protein